MDAKTKEAKTKDTKTKKAKKTDIAEQMFVRAEGATMQEIIAATGGPQYNKLKQLEGLGYVIRRDKDGDATRYFARPPKTARFAVTLTEKGQVTIPRQVRERLHLRSGHKVEFVVEGEDRAVMRPAGARLSDLAGILGRPKRKITLEEMDEGIRQAAVDRYLRAVGAKKR